MGRNSMFAQAMPTSTRREIPPNQMKPLLRIVRIFSKMDIGINGKKGAGGPPLKEEAPRHSNQITKESIIV